MTFPTTQRVLSRIEASIADEEFRLDHDMEDPDDDFDSWRDDGLAEREDWFRGDR